MYSAIEKIQQAKLNKPCCKILIQPLRTCYEEFRLRPSKRLRHVFFERESCEMRFVVAAVKSLLVN